MLHKDSNTTGEVSANLLISLHQGLLKVRLTEELLAERYKQQEMRTPTHFGIGQEAVAVGVCHALRRDDVVYSHRRCHNHYLAKGGSVYKLAAELYGRAEGCSGGARRLGAHYGAGGRLHCDQRHPRRDHGMRRGVGARVQDGWKRSRRRHLLWRRRHG
jgi:TPP-dependent pyruvate/acetoin dehydrogenase alpha subunit